MEPYHYHDSGLPIRVGDRVRIKRKILRDLEGVVDRVFGASKPMPPNMSNNELGFSVKVGKGAKTYWRSFGGNHPSVELLERAGGQNET